VDFVNFLPCFRTLWLLEEPLLQRFHVFVHGVCLLSNGQQYQEMGAIAIPKGQNYQKFKKDFWAWRKGLSFVTFRVVDTFPLHLVGWGWCRKCGL
jgi:hypothetical protein